MNSELKKIRFLTDLAGNLFLVIFTSILQKLYANRIEKHMQMCYYIFVNRGAPRTNKNTYKKENM